LATRIDGPENFVAKTSELGEEDEKMSFAMENYRLGIGLTARGWNVEQSSTLEYKIRG
jgi:hypothetical protein